MDDDVVSTFSYEDEEDTDFDSFNLTALTSVANNLFSPKRCTLEKLAQGGFHKIYNVFTSDGDELGVVARVASPCFPKDKLESEIATLKCITEKTSVPVPTVLAWNSDIANEVGAEYMFLSKIAGVSAFNVWSDLSLDVKKNTVRQVAKHMLDLWGLRFHSLGSLYLAEDETSYKVGPIVSTRFYKKLDGMPRTRVPIDLSEYRGPFSSISSYLASGLLADLRLYAECRDDLIDEADGIKEHVESGKKAMEMALPLCDKYPGDRPISADAKEPITLCLDDFRLTNIMIDPVTGDVHGLIDFESTTTAPGWLCADIPSWLHDEDTELYDTLASYRYDSSGSCGEGGSTRKYMSAETVADTLEYIKSLPPTEEAILQKEFLDTMKSLDRSGTWIRAYQAGKSYREFAASLGAFITQWGKLTRGRWVESALRWLEKHPAEELPGNLDFRYPDIVESWKQFDA